jgi:hypothetical protein
MAKATKVLISERAIVQRLNRALAKDDKKLKKASRGRAAMDLGPWYMIDTSINGVMFRHKQMGPAELEELATELGAIKPWETVERSR